MVTTQEQGVRRLTYVQAVNEALRQEHERDPTVFIMGEDIAGGAGREDQGKQDAWGRRFQAHQGPDPAVRRRAGYGTRPYRRRHL